jgi:hypothetical protein
MIYLESVAVYLIATKLTVCRRRGLVVRPIDSAFDSRLNIILRSLS